MLSVALVLLVIVSEKGDVVFYSIVLCGVVEDVGLKEGEEGGGGGEEGDVGLWMGA